MRKILQGQTPRGLTLGGLTLLFLAGCGYSATRLLPAEYQVITVEPFQNQIPITEEVTDRFGYQTYLPQLEEDVTRGLIDRFLLDGNLRITTQAEEADLILTGQLRDFYRQALRRLDDDEIEEYRLNLVGSFSVRDRQGKVVVEEPELVADVTYFLIGPSAKSESTAVDELIVDFSRRIVEKVIENW